MAGVKGRSGGARPGSGRKGKPPVVLEVSGDEPLDFLLTVMKTQKAPVELRVRAAIAAAQYVHTRTKDGGAKARDAKAAKKAAEGKFAPPSAPKLVVSNK